ncbi:MAG: toll/interleukin-1 receptor domain-containing protein [Candidatus Binatus sp.]
MASGRSRLRATSSPGTIGVMLDQEAMQIARNRLNAESARRGHLFSDELQRVQSEFAIKGLAHSGALIRAVADVCAKEIEDATERLWEIIRDLLRETDAAPSPEAVATLYRQIDELWVPYRSAGPEEQFEAICRRDGTDLLSMKNATNFGNRNIGARMRIRSEVEQFVRSLRNRVRVGTASSDRSKVFLSHAASDRSIASLLKAEIERRLPGVSVFCSSDPADLPPGTKWSAAIQEALQDATMLIFVASERGVQRQWVWFECGTFWFSRRKIMPLCLGQVRKNALRQPLSELQAINGDESSDLKTALDVVATATGLSVSDASDLDGLSEKLKLLDREAAAVMSAASGWLGAEWDGKFIAYKGPYEVLPRIEDHNFGISMQEALKAAGYTVTLYDRNNFAAMAEPNHFVWLTDRKSWRCRVVKGDAYLVARPT